MSTGTFRSSSSVYFLGGNCIISSLLCIAFAPFVAAFLFTLSNKSCFHAPSTLPPVPADVPLAEGFLYRKLADIEGWE